MVTMECLARPWAVSSFSSEDIAVSRLDRCFGFGLGGGFIVQGRGRGRGKSGEVWSPDKGPLP